MYLLPWEQLPKNMQTDSVKYYYDFLSHKLFYLQIKRLMDIVISFIILCLTFPIFIIIAILIKVDSNGPIIYKQQRITQYGKKFEIYKFRTMIVNADKSFQITQHNDIRITRIGKILRKYKLDELPQFINVLQGSLTLCGTRPEVPAMVEQYSDGMMATLLLPAGITSLTSIKFKNESEFLLNSDNPDKDYAQYILPWKMACNLEELRQAGLIQDIKILCLTFLSLFN